MKAIALISGGLDSILAARLIKELGIEVIGLNFDICFTKRKKEALGISGGPLKKATENIGIKIETIEIGQDFLKLLKNPEHGFGANMNPCIDCKILMLSKAKELMAEKGAFFVVTGEVLGQRPMSQYKKALENIEKKSGLEGLLLRPLCAQLLTETIPEKKGWVKREKLLAFSGRTRKPQMQLAKEFGITDYPNAAGGCLLTEPEFSGRLRDLMQNGELNLENIELLKIGRHFKISPKTRLIVGRDKEENQRLLELIKKDDYLFRPENILGPVALGRGIFNAELLKLSCNIICRYCDLNGKIKESIIYEKYPQEKGLVLEVSPLEKEELLALKI